jgi:GNAT superfamily N-acetyltransferase
MEELDFFYGASEVEPLSHRARTISDELFGEVPAGQVLLAWDDDQLVGLAAYSYLWPAAGVSRSLFLKELYVAQSHRRRGFGKLLMQKLLAVAAEHGCSRVEWMTDADNGGAQRFYADLNVPVDTSKLFYRAQVTANRIEPEAQV